MLNKKLALKFALGSLAFAAGSVFAYEPQGGYVLGGINYTRLEKAKLSSTQTLPALGSGADGAASRAFTPDLREGNEVGMRLGFGTILDENFGAEVNAFTFRKFDSSADVGSGAALTKMNLETKGWIVDLTGVVRTELAAEIDGFLKVGVGYAWLDRKLSPTVTGLSVNKPELKDSDENKVAEIKDSAYDLGISGLGVALGGGVEYRVNEQMGVRIDANGLFGGDIQVMTVNASVVIHFM